MVQNGRVHTILHDIFFFCSSYIYDNYFQLSEMPPAGQCKDKGRGKNRKKTNLYTRKNGKSARERCESLAQKNRVEEEMEVEWNRVEEQVKEVERNMGDIGDVAKQQWENVVKNSKRNIIKIINCKKKGRPDLKVSGPAFRISFDDISLSNYQIIFKISYKYLYRIFFENITLY